MKALVALGFCALVASMVTSPSAASAEPRPSPGAPSESAEPTNLVVSFYRALLQKEAPTLQQEKALFGLSSALRVNLLARRKGTESDPVLLQLFRQHRELFLPLGELSKEEYLAAVQITSPFNFVRSVARIKDKLPTGRAWVMALFVHDAKLKASRFRTVLFSIEHGKIKAGEICFDGFQGQMALEKFVETVPVKD